MICGALLSLLATIVRDLVRVLRRPDHTGGNPHRLIERVIDSIEVVLEYLIWVLEWACWLVDWIIRLPLILVDLLGIEFRVSLGVSVRIVTDDAGVPAVPPEKVQGWLRDAERILTRCNVGLVLHEVELIRGEGCLGTTACTFSCIFRRFFTWFAARASGGCHRVTVYVVRSIRGASGCAYPGSNWMMVAANADGTVILHEIGHLCDLWTHPNCPDNVMTVRGGGSHNQITRGQRSMIRTSRFMRVLPRGWRETRVRRPPLNTPD